MIIDFHTHTFPDKIAAMAITSLKHNSRTENFLSGTLSDLSEDGCDNHIDLSVVLPVVTTPEKADKINVSCAKSNELVKNVFSIGGIHPDTPDHKEVIKHIAELGLKGIKIHPAYQRVPLNDIRFKRIIECAQSNGLFVIAHGGLDIGIEGDWSSPKMAREILDEIHPDTFIMAHMGGWNQWNDVEKYLIGQKIYLDTAFSYATSYAYQQDVPSLQRVMPLQEEQFVRMVNAHGADKILFGTDSPWMDRKVQIEMLKTFPLTKEQLNKILGENAENLLKL